MTRKTVTHKHAKAMARKHDAEITYIDRHANQVRQPWKAVAIEVRTTYKTWFAWID